MTEHPFQRYFDLVDDQKAFIKACETPLPRTIWANSSKGDLDTTADRVRQLCPEAMPMSWHPYAWRLPPDSRPGHWLIHLAGQIHVQEEVAMLAGHLFGAQSGERVLDLCAAPGGKTAQIALAMGDQGSVVANDRAFKRLSPLRRTMERLGLTSVGISHHDGVRFPIPEILFDRILVDAPCTCEGTSRKTTQYTTAVDAKFRHSIVQIQKALLRRAVKLCRSGGTILYATCTYAPEENEGVLSSVSIDDVVIEPMELPDGWRVANPITHWQGEMYRPDVVHGCRIWPHQNDTGGFFIARLRRL